MSQLVKVRHHQTRRQHRIRANLARRPDSNRPRLSVAISNRHIRAQVIDDTKGHTLVSASSLKLDLKGDLSTKAVEVGRQIGQLCLKAKIERVVFDRGRRRYHGRIKKLAEAARQEGLKF